MQAFESDWVILENGYAVDTITHRNLSEEYLFYKAVVEGDTEKVMQNINDNRFAEKEGMGVLSRNPLTNIKYHFVVGTAMITRYCFQNGMEFEKAFRLSDYYIQKLDDLHTEKQVHQLHDEMVMDFTNKMRLLKRRDTVSKHVNLCKEYIYSHLKERIRVEEIADALSVTPAYLSRLFKKETGITISQYIIDRKIKATMDLLKFSEEPISEIASRFSFASQSHYIKHFRELVGMTPKKYRDKFFMHQWDI